MQYIIIKVLQRIYDRTYHRFLERRFEQQQEESSYLAGDNYDYLNDDYSHLKFKIRRKEMSKNSYQNSKILTVGTIAVAMAVCAISGFALGG